jgi:hypothetical protein
MKRTPTQRLREIAEILERVKKDAQAWCHGPPVYHDYPVTCERFERMCRLAKGER